MHHEISMRTLWVIFIVVMWAASFQGTVIIGLWMDQKRKAARLDPVSQKGSDMAAINKPEPPFPDDSADVEASRLLQNHIARGVKSTPARTSPGSASTKARQVTGTKQGGTRLRGGRG
jgi:hypothetical protein